MASIFFSWPIVGTIVAIFIGIGGVAMSTGPFFVARISFTFAALLLLTKFGIWISSETFELKWRIVATFIIFGIVGVGWLLSWQWIKSNELLQLSGIIAPDNKPTPAHTFKNIPDNSFILFLGNSIAFTNNFPHIVILVGNEPILTLNIVNKQLTISAKFFDAEGLIVAELNNNKFTINRLNYYKIERPNYHTLTVYDQRDIKILSVEYINPKVIKFLGRFNLSGRPPIIIEENEQFWGGG